MHSIMSDHVSMNESNDLEEDEIDFDVIVVGAGLSGLTATYKLISSGLNILILEKSITIGGRLLSNKESKTFFAHDVQKRVDEMVKRLRLSKEREKFPDERKIVHLLDNGNSNKNLPFYVAGEIYYFVKMMDKMSKHIHAKIYKDKICEKLSNISVENVLKRLVFFRKSRSLCRNLIYITCGIRQLKNISAFWYLIMLNGAGGFLQRLRVNLGDQNRYFIKNGAMRIAQGLIERIVKESQISFSQQVCKIQFNNDRAHIWTKNKHYKCNYIIIAVPPTAISEIVIEPDLPLELKKIQSSFEQGKNIYFNGICTQMYNGLAKNIIGATNNNTNLRLAFNATCKNDKKFYISGYLSNSNNDPMVKVNFLTILKRYFGNALTFDEYTETSNLQITGGTPMDVLKPINLKKRVNLLSKSHGRIFFAASEYARNWPGTIDGAIEAGESVAHSILVRARPQSVNRFEWILYRSSDTHFYLSELKIGTILVQNVCFWINLIVSLSFLRMALIKIIQD